VLLIQVPPFCPSHGNTLTSGFSAKRRATTDPEEPDPQTMKSFCDFKFDLSLSQKTFPIDKGIDLPLACGFGCVSTG
jgi:hypothetical protein